MTARALGLIAFGFVLVVACSKHEEQIDPLTPVEKPHVTKPNATDASADDASSILVAPAPTSCADAAALKPQATFDADKLAPLSPITPVDMYALEEGDVIDDGENPVHAYRRLRLILTEQAGECSVRKGAVVPAQVNELEFAITRSTIGSSMVPPPIGKDVYFTDKQHDPDVAIEFSQTAGARCSNDPGQEAAHSVAEAVNGSIAIDARTATEVEGSITVVNAEGKATHVTFKAPICDGASLNVNGLCCLGK